MVQESTAEIFVPAGATLGEGPAWDAAAGCLAWVDILEQRVHLTEPDGSARASFEFDSHIGAVLPGAPEYLVVRRDGFATLDPATGAVKELLSVLGDRPDMRFNDAKAGPGGRVFAGTMRYDEGRDEARLFRLDPGPVATVVHGPVSLSNGLGWSPDNRTFYFCESFRYAIFVYDFDPDAGVPSARRMFATVDHGSGGFPDGLTVDAEGGVWSAQNGAGRVVRYAPDGEVTHEVEVPVPQPTSCMFGGPDLDVLYITTSRQNMTPQQLGRYPLSGSVFALRPGLSGLPEPLFAG